MSHPTFDHTLHEANLWLKTVAQTLHLDDQRHGYSALRASLHALRDRLPPERAVHFGAQLPMLIRGLYYEGWRLTGKPTGERSIEDFCAHVARELPPHFPMDARSVARGVFDTLARLMDAGEIGKVIDQMPLPLRTLWPEAAHRA